jgi:Dolichyl-phosphate-mannose-protein mannosyltransferase
MTADLTGAPRDTKTELLWLDSLLVALLAFASACLVATNIWENGDIELKWLAIKAWADGDFPAFAPNHHNMRWGITLPAVAFVKLFGGLPLSYLLLNHLAFALTTAGLYALIRKLTTPLVAALALGMWLINPVSYSLPGNLMPEVWTMFYLVGGLLLLQKAYESGSRWTYAAAIAVFFLMYGAKETNVFFMPGIGLYELYRRRWTNVGIMVAVFSAGLLIETLIVNAALAESHIMFGRAQAIVQAGHLDEMSSDWPYQWSDLFTRWLFYAETNFDRLEYFAKLIYWAFFLVTAWKAWTWIRARSYLPPPGEIGPSAAPGGEAISTTWAMGLTFAFFSSFFILSFNPLTLGQPLNDRYLWPLLVPAYVVLSVAAKAGLAKASDARAGFAGVIGKLQRFLTPVAAGRAGLVSLVIIAAFCTLARWPIEVAAVKIRRQGHDQPYTVFTVSQYFGEIRQHLLDGCTLAFPRPRPAQTTLIHAFPYKSITPVLGLYRETQDGLDGLMIEGHSLRAWLIPPSDWEMLRGKLYAEIDHVKETGFKPFAIRLERAGTCNKVYWLGQVDMAPQDQLIEGKLSVPSVPVIQP